MSRVSGRNQVTAVALVLSLLAHVLLFVWIANFADPASAKAVQTRLNIQLKAGRPVQEDVGSAVTGVPPDISDHRLPSTVLPNPARVDTSADSSSGFLSSISEVNPGVEVMEFYESVAETASELEPVPKAHIG